MLGYREEKDKMRIEKDKKKESYYLLKNYMYNNLKKDDIVCLNLSICQNDIKTSLVLNDKEYLNRVDKIKEYIEGYIEGIEDLKGKIGIYVLKLEREKYYIGCSTDLYMRILSHWVGLGTAFTRYYKPIDIVEYMIFKKKENLLKLEDKVTIDYIKKYGKYSVRGGIYCNEYKRIQY